MFPSLKKDHVLSALIGLLALVPVTIWLTMEPLAVRFADHSQALTSVGQVSALVGTVLFSIGILLRTSTETTIGTVRSKSELTALLLLLAHPIVLAVEAIPDSAVTMTGFLFPFGDWVLRFGTYALLALLAYYAIQFCAGKHTYLEATPRALGLVLFLGTLHAFFIPSDLSRNPLLQVYMLTVIFTTFASYIYQISVQKISLRQGQLQLRK